MCLMTLGLTASAEDVSAGSVLWADDFGSTVGDGQTTFAKVTTTVSDYDYSGRTGYSANASSVTYTGNSKVVLSKVEGTNVADTHLWFEKQGQGVFTTSAINLYGATKVNFSLDRSKGLTVVSYSFDGNTWTELWKETNTGAVVNKNANIETYGKENIYIKIVEGNNSNNLRVDNLSLTAVEVGGTSVKLLSSIAVTTQPTKTEYTVGDALDLTGCVVTATYSDNTTANVTSSCTFSPANGAKLETTGTQNVSVSYENKTTSFNVTVKAASTPGGGDDEPSCALTIDFEKEATAYSDWTFTNITTKQTNSNVPAHGGDYFGTTGGKETGSIQTNSKIAAPKSITFYVTKQTTNTTASSWIVQVSSDANTWEDVKKQSASSVTRGVWTEVSQDLTDYSDIYVRVYYTGSTAVRCIDDLTLEVSGEVTPPSSDKTLSSIAVSGTATELWTGDAFSNKGITVTATYDDNSTENVTAKAEYSGYDMTAAGNQTVTVSYGGKTATYSVEVKTIANTEATAYTATEAIALINAGKGLKQGVYVKGIVSQIVTAYDSKFGNITFNVSEDGTTGAAQFQFFRNQKSATETYPEDPNIQVGAEVVGYGTLTKYNTTYEFAAGNYNVSYVASTKLTPVLSFEAEEYTVNLGEEFVAPTLTNESNVVVSYSSSKEEVATVDAATGAVTLVGAGTTTITAKFAGNDTYNAAQASYTLVVEESKPVVETVERAIVTNYNGTWYAATPELSSKKLQAVEVVVMDGKVYYAGDKTIAWAFDETNGTFGTEDGKYLAQSGTGTDVAIVETGNITWSFETKGIVNANTKDRVLIYKSGTGFGNYSGTNAGKSGYTVKSELLPIATAEELAAAMAEAANVEITSAGYATYCPMFANVAIPANVEVYSVLSNPKNDVVALTKYEGTTLKQGEGVILVGDANTYTFAATADDATAIEGNLLKGVTSDTELAETTAYILANGAEGVGFYLNETGTIKAGKAYLPASSSSAAPVLKFVIEDANAIQSATEAEGYKLKANGAYNLAGQKVAADYKGIVIINGKKYLKK